MIIAVCYEEMVEHGLLFYMHSKERYNEEDPATHYQSYSRHVLQIYYCM